MKQAVVKSYGKKGENIVAMNQLAVEAPEWDPKRCIECNQCSYVCPTVPSVKAGPWPFYRATRSCWEPITGIVNINKGEIS